MKIKVSVPTEPVCTVKLEIDEAMALYGWLSGDAQVQSPASREDVAATFRKLLRQALDIPERGDLFKDE